MEGDLREYSPTQMGRWDDGSSSQDLRVSLHPRTHSWLWGFWTGGGGHGSWSEPFTGHHESGRQDAEM